MLRGDQESGPGRAPGQSEGRLLLDLGQERLGALVLGVVEDLPWRALLDDATGPGDVHHRRLLVVEQARVGAGANSEGRAATSS